VSWEAVGGGGGSDQWAQAAPGRSRSCTSLWALGQLMGRARRAKGAAGRWAGERAVGRGQARGKARAG
jgi:hypothetical protein